MTVYYAVCNVGGPISVRLEGETVEAAMSSFDQLEGQEAADEGRTDLEDVLPIAGSADMDEGEFALAIEAAGARFVLDCSEVYNAQSGAVMHIEGGWTLWAVES